jgi:hypothetical protein
MAFSSFFMLEKTVLRVERRVWSCSTRLLNSVTTLTDSGTVTVAVTAVVVVADSTTGAGAATATATGAAATGAGATTGAVAVEAAVVEVALRPFLEAIGAEAEEVEVDILYLVPRNFFREINAGMLIQLLKKKRVIFSLREREKVTDFCAFDFFQKAIEPKDL